MDASMLERMPTRELQTRLREDYNGNRSLSVEQILCICEILAARKASTEKEIRAAWDRYLTHYAPK